MERTLYLKFNEGPKGRGARSKWFVLLICLLYTRQARRVVPELVSIASLLEGCCGLNLILIRNSMYF